ncbi:MAG: hypothetical protein NTW95_13310 [Candidatus Aminicenantes bacterium]|nr:hypothetical protein [Candidatus Aminicenantes bacterium]
MGENRSSMKLEEHELESLSLFGKPFTEVHLWLDEFARTPEFGMRHRRKRHHREGLREVEELFGWDAALVARLHVISDLKKEGWKESDRFPEDEADYVRMGLF